MRVTVNVLVRGSNQNQKPARPIKDIIPHAGFYQFTVGQEEWTVKVESAITLYRRTRTEVTFVCSVRITTGELIE